MENKTLTAVEWLEEEIRRCFLPAQKHYFKWAFEQAKEMEKQHQSYYENFIQSLKNKQDMSYKLTAEEENPLWRNYMNKNKDESDLQEVVLETPFPSKTFGTYSEEDFLQRLKEDEVFNSKWGKI
jgi:hypothetical protein